MLAQIPLVDSADAIDAVASTAAGGFAGITLAIEQCQVHVYWMGPLPPAVATAVEVERHNVNVVVHTDSRYPQLELGAWADQLLDEPSYGLAAGVEVTAVSVLPEGTGLEVDVWPLPAEPPTAPEAAALAALNAFRQQGFPVVAVHAVPPVEVAGRADDRSPWIAGAVHRVPGGGTCTTGWAMQDGADRYLLTAAHCIGPLALGANIRNGDGTRVIGTVAGYMRAIDSAIIQINVGGGDTVWPRTWWGDIGGVETMRVVDDWDGTYKGQRICTSGAATGVHCFTKVTDSDYRYRNNLGWRVTVTATTWAGGSTGPPAVPMSTAMWPPDWATVAARYSSERSTPLRG